MFIVLPAPASTCSVSLPTLASEFRYFSGKMVLPQILVVKVAWPCIGFRGRLDPVLTNKSTVLFYTGIGSDEHMTQATPIRDKEC